MTDIVVDFPRKTRELHNHHMDSTVWNDFAFRDGDVVVATYGKSGTTWTQQIVAQLIFQGAEGVPVNMLSPWYDLRIVPPEARAAVAAPGSPAGGEDPPSGRCAGDVAEGQVPLRGS